MRAYSQDLRDRVLNALERGERPTDIAVRFEVSRGWVHEIRKQLRVEGRRTSLQIGGHATYFALLPIDYTGVQQTKLGRRVASENGALETGQVVVGVICINLY